jgi:hypothetical protein
LREIAKTAWKASQEKVKEKSDGYFCDFFFSFGTKRQFL